MPHSQRGLESGLASEGVQSAGTPGARSQVIEAEHSRVFVSAAPTPFENTSENMLHLSPQGTQTPFSITPAW